MKKNILILFYFLCYYFGIINLFYFINRKKQRILVFHHIIPDSFKNDSFEQNIVCTEQSHFRWLLSIINHRFIVTTDIGKPGTVVITFDDGYRAALTAKKELDHYNNKAYFFVPLSIIDNGPLWIDYIMGWFAYVPNGIYKIYDNTYHLINQNSRLQAFSTIINELYIPHQYHYQHLLELLESIHQFNKLPISNRYYNERFRGLTQKELSLLKAEDFKIGGHSRNHDILSCLSDCEIKEDFAKCSNHIGSIYNSKIFAYPFGHERDVSQCCIEACTDSKFEYALMNEFVQKETNYRLSRIKICDYKTRYEVEAALSGLTQSIKNVLKWIMKK